MNKEQLNALKQWIDIRIAWMISDEKGEIAADPYYDPEPFIQYEKEFDKVMLGE